MGDITIRNVFLPFHDPAKATELYNVICQSGKVHAIVKSSEHDGEVWQEAQQLDGGDKCFILDKCDRLLTGDFPEALRVTAAAKAQFPHDLDDLYERGKRLIVESVESGVTCMRAHVEIDATVKQSCLKIALRLKKDLSHLCDIQIAVFAQDPIASGETRDAGDHSLSNLGEMQAALVMDGIEAIGSAPYVESNIDESRWNVQCIFDLAWDHKLHVDFHLDYNLDSSQTPLIWFVLGELQARIAAGKWDDRMHVCIGHATRLTMFSSEEWTKFTNIVKSAHLPVTLVGLPQSDLYMMGRSLEPIPRGTLNVVELERKYGVQVAMAVNNVGNAFTPQGPPDPLALCPLGVAIFQAGTTAASQALVALNVVQTPLYQYPEIWLI
ncbi:hypothetical protein EUX98_g3534 [Antrodiella citrinella]|uniref:Amidohydrolase-related domain-containing protein n=1 Tax=Antrodiella citrinella TaxID=2447956 RepID=A0A4S4MYD8_9APHY|nr:hypothetical protein EUX98_g3534 [Antrodiella citrinella]